MRGLNLDSLQKLFLGTVLLEIPTNLEWKFLPRFSCPKLSKKVVLFEPIHMPTISVTSLIVIRGSSIIILFTFSMLLYSKKNLIQNLWSLFSTNNRSWIVPKQTYLLELRLIQRQMNQDKNNFAHRTNITRAILKLLLIFKHTSYYWLKNWTDE